MKPSYQEFKDLILRSKTAVVAAHIDPDGDTLGSMLAMGIILRGMGLDVVMYSSGGVPNTYKFLSDFENIVNHAPKKEFDILVTVDASRLERIGDAKINAKTIVNIDHHPDNSNFGNINYVELLSSVGELIFKIAKEFGAEITPEMACDLYVAIITDTGSFRYSNTFPSTFLIAKELAEKGANPYQIASLVNDAKSIESLKICAEVVYNMQYTPDKKIIWSIISKDIIQRSHAKSEDFIGIIDHLRSIKECEIAIILREEKSGMIKINLRSKGKANVSRIANEMGGGGHVQAAGCEVNMTLPEAQDKVIALAKKELSLSS